MSGRNLAAALEAEGLDQLDAAELRAEFDRLVQAPWVPRDGLDHWDLPEAQRLLLVGLALERLEVS